jgi:hypothetical protein
LVGARALSGGVVTKARSLEMGKSTQNTNLSPTFSQSQLSISIMQVPLIRLQCGANSYDWGKIGNDSAAAKFAAATPADDFSIQQDKPYAEVYNYIQLSGL